MKLDVRGDDGYVIVPPSIHPSGRRYTWRGRFADLADLPPRALAILRDRAEPPRLQLHRDPVPAAIPEGQRNATLARLAGAWRRLGTPEAVILSGLVGVNNAHVDPPLEADELLALVKSIGRYPPPANTPPTPSAFSGGTPARPVPAGGLAGGWGRL